MKGKRGKTEMFAVDEHPRETSPEKLASLLPVFKENGTVTAGNASVGAALYLASVAIFSQCCYI